MGTTLNRAYRYPGQGVEPDVPTDIQQLAEDVDADVVGIHGALDPLIPGGWVNIALANAWVPSTSGGGYYLGLQARNAGPTLQINGMIKSGAVGSVIGYLPAGSRPLYTTQVAQFTASGVANVLVSATDGAITYLSGPAAPASLSLNINLPR